MFSHGTLITLSLVPWAIRFCVSVAASFSTSFLLYDVATSWWVQNVERLRPIRAMVAGNRKFITVSFETRLDVVGCSIFSMFWDSWASMRRPWGEP